jgi:hypothetical protein
MQSGICTRFLLVGTRSPLVAHASTQTQTRSPRLAPRAWAVLVQHMHLDQG